MVENTPGPIELRLVPRGALNSEIYAGLLGYAEEQFTRLEDDSVISNVGGFEILQRNVLGVLASSLGSGLQIY
jgi:hypothetical protein